MQSQTTMPPNDTDAVREAIQANFQEMMQAMAEGDAAGLASHFAEDALLKFPGQEPLQGRAAIEGAHEQMIAQGISVRPKTEEVESFGEMAYEIGTYELVAGNGEVVDHGHYATIWKRVDGSWQLYRDVISSSVGGDSQ